MIIFHICTIISDICAIITILLCNAAILNKLTEPHENVECFYEYSYNENYLGCKWFYIFIVLNVICYLFYKKIKKIRLLDYYKYEINFYEDLLIDECFYGKNEINIFNKYISKYKRLLKLEQLK
jgi:hypothetical protein